MQNKSINQSKPLFEEGTFLYNISYGIANKIRNGQISFAKVFWIGFFILMGLNILILFVLELGEAVKEIVEIFSCIIWARLLWLGRKNIYHPLWFYIGFLFSLLPIFVFLIRLITIFVLRTF